jgi:pimeloyl-[acyl-carrier protein] methyl ester esterase
MLSDRQPAYQCWGNSTAKKQIILIHGWGMNSGVWTNVAQRLSKIFPQYLIRAVDLPGYGQSITCCESLWNNYSSHTLAKSLTHLLTDKQTTLVAWSMGGLIAIELVAQATFNIEQLILVGTTPRFVQTEDWPDAVEASLFKEFFASLEDDHNVTLRRFLAIQALGSRTAKEDISKLQAQLLERGKPNPLALKKGLEILFNDDKRSQLAQIKTIPISLISGRLDTLAKYKGQQKLATQANIFHYSIAAAGHAPFISHPQEFQTLLQSII